MLPTDAAEKLYNLTRESEGLYVFFDSQAKQRLPDELSQADERRVPRLHLEDPFFDETPWEAPLLLQLRRSEIYLMDSFAELAWEEAVVPYAMKRSVCGFIQSSLDLPTLGRRLQDRLRLNVDQKEVYFRYFDPRVMHHLPRLLTAEQWTHGWRGIESWSHFLWDGTLETHRIPEPPVRGPLGNLRMTTSQWLGFKAIAHFNATQRLFALHDLPFASGHTEILFSQVQSVCERGLTEPLDVACFMVCAHLIGESRILTGHPNWRSVLSLVKAEVPLEDALKAICEISLPDLLIARASAKSTLI